MKLAELLNGLAECKLDLEIEGLCLDSRKIRAGDVFLAVNGGLQHGLKHAPQALTNGAIAIIYDPEGVDNAKLYTGNSPAIAVNDLSLKLGAIASRFYGSPSSKLAVVGITGTNGKTTCSQLLAQALENCGVIGTLGWGRPGDLQPTANTTPDALETQFILRQFAAQGLSAAAMEVSSHGLQQGRVGCVEFTGAVFTNLSRDHLDYHGTMEEYLRAKLGLFTVSGLRFAVVNLDDANSEAVLNALDPTVECWGFSTSGWRADECECIVADKVEHHDNGISFDVHWRGQSLRADTPIAGVFNLQNVLTVLCVLLAMKTPFAQAVAKLAHLKPVNGRMEKFGGNGKPAVFVDYAHTPDALEKVLQSAKCEGQLWAIFGCGGDRDKGKRPEMGRIAETCADHVVLTDDNPRSEAPVAIIEDILSGCSSDKVRVINDRKQAITTTILRAAANDCVVVAGKGHENYQEIAGIKLPFSDQDVVREALASWGECA